MKPVVALRWFVGLAALQFLCALFFVSEFVTEVLGWRTWALPFAWREVLQILASLGLIIGAFSSICLILMMRRQMTRLSQQLRAASGDFHNVMDEFFDSWSLSPSERDVALFAVRGFTNTEIAELRGTGEATVKTQINAIFRKAGVNSRSQLLGLFVDALLENGAT